MITIVYIGASWCTTCKIIKPALIEMCKKYGVDLKTLDYDDDLESAEQDSITKVPTIKIFSDKHKVAEFNNNQIASTESWLRANVKLSATDDF